MCILKKCCYCVELRIGAIVTAVFNLLEIVYAIGITTYFAASSKIFSLHDDNNAVAEMLIESVRTFIILYIIILCISVLGLVSLGLGIFTSKSIFLLFWIVIEVIQIVITSCICIVALAVKQDLVIGNFVIAICMVYFWIVIISYYQKLSGGSVQRSSRQM